MRQVVALVYTQARLTAPYADDGSTSDVRFEVRCAQEGPWSTHTRLAGVGYGKVGAGC